MHERYCRLQGLCLHAQGTATSGTSNANVDIAATSGAIIFPQKTSRQLISVGQTTVNEYTVAFRNKNCSRVQLVASFVSSLAACHLTSPSETEDVITSLSAITCSESSSARMTRLPLWAISADTSSDAVPLNAGAVVTLADC